MAQPDVELAGIVIRPQAEALRWQLCLVLSPAARGSAAVKELLRVLGDRRRLAG